MGMSTNVIGFRPPDEKWKQMKAIWDSCKSANVEPPREVSRFFNDAPPDAAGVEVKLDELVLVEWNADMRDGFEVDLELLRKHHPNVTKVRFWNSY